MKKLFYKKIIYSSFLVLFLFLCGCKNDNEDIKIESFTLGVSDMLLGVEEVLPVVVLPSPNNITEKIEWKSSDPEIAQVQTNEFGLVSGIMGVNVGSTTITASTTDGKIKQSIEVTVIIKVKKIAFGTEKPIAPDKTQYDIVFTPENPTYQDLIWTSSNPEVAKVEDGIITAVSAGSSIITVTTVKEGKSASVEVFVSGTPPKFGKEYCTIAGSGSYCPDEVRTQDAVQNLTHIDKDIPSRNYKYYPENKLIVKRGSSFTINIVQSNNWSWSAVWIDWNGDYNFSSKEQVTIFGNPEMLNDGPFSKAVNVPSNAFLGIVRMRVITGDSWTVKLPTFEPCGNVSNGTIKDFDVEIIN